MRYLKNIIREDLASKMVFLGGPRQVGKTTFAKALLSEFGSSEKDYYKNWDVLEHRKELLKERIPAEGPLVVLDEIHKYHGWRGLVKGFFDLHGATHPLLVTGSARLDHFRKGGDSLQGRYHYFRLHPFTYPEFRMQTRMTPDGNTPHSAVTLNLLQRLLQFGGFPEPLFASNETHWRRWQLERQSRIVNEDIRDLEHIQELSKMELLMDILPTKVGSPLSIKSLQEDLLCSHESANKWVGILENMYVCFRIPPYGPPKIRAVKKEQKLYMWDWSQVEDKGAKYENMMASHLLKYCHYIQDTQGFKMELRYLRDTDKREVDFVILQNKKPLFAVEAKYQDETLSPNLEYFSKRTGIPAFYQVVFDSPRAFGNPETTGQLLSFRAFCDKIELV